MMHWLVVCFKTNFPLLWDKKVQTYLILPSLTQSSLQGIPFILTSATQTWRSLWCCLSRTPHPWWAEHTAAGGWRSTKWSGGTHRWGSQSAGHRRSWSCCVGPAWHSGCCLALGCGFAGKLALVADPPTDPWHTHGSPVGVRASLNGQNNEIHAWRPKSKTQIVMNKEWSSAGGGGEGELLENKQIIAFVHQQFHRISRIVFHGIYVTWWQIWLSGLSHTHTHTHTHIYTKVRNKTKAVYSHNTAVK